MTKPHHSAFVTAVLLASVVLGALALGGPAAALEADRSSPYPDTVGSSAQTPVAVFAEEGDAIVEEGLAALRFDYGVGDFDGSVGNITDDDVSILVSRESGDGRTVATQLDAVNVSIGPNGEQLTAQLSRTLQIQAGDRIVTFIDNFSTPTEADQYTVEVTAVSQSGAEDGPVSVGYAADRATLEFDNQTASQFGPQRVNVSGVVPSYGYVAVFRSDNGTRGELLGSTEVTPSFDVQNFSVALEGAVTEPQELMAVSYYETSGDTLSARREASFDPNRDEPFTNNGVVANATGFVSVVDAGGQVQTGSSYERGAGLFFDQGEAETAYALRAVEDGQPGATALEFETGSDGTTILNTSDLDTGPYTIVRLSDGSVLNLDGDDTTSAADDSFRITPPSTAEATETTGTPEATTAADADTTDADATDADATDATDGGFGGVENTSDDTTDGTPADAIATDGTETGGAVTDGTPTDGAAGTTDGGDGGDGDGGSNLPGPGFGIGVAVVAVLAAALLTARRRA